MAEAQVDVLIYPTLRRKPALMVNPNSARLVMLVGIPVYRRFLYPLVSLQMVCQSVLSLWRVNGKSLC
jgi:hypothetical protein